MKLRSVRARAHAKVNLDLRVLGTRADGYHELRAVFQSVALFDTITCTARRGKFSIACRTPGVPLDEDNLVWQAAAMLWKTLGFGGRVRDVHVRIEKQIPMQAGLGGGSSDAAATLVALGRLWAGQPPVAHLRELGAQLGADVAFFLTGGTALGLGAGEEIYPLVDLPAHWIVLVIPPFGVSTREAYGWYDEERAAGYAQARERQVLPIPWPSRAAQMINDLEPPIARRHPEITEAKSALRDAGAIAAAMSGSGSAVFGLFRGRREAATAVPRLSREGWSVLLTRTLDRAEYERRSRPAPVRR
ncbi:MAG: 4-(cytidine 5'-diphospho)-2-C-methyl-D-erythritol kinase [Vicinamibacterales bacterium]